MMRPAIATWLALCTASARADRHEATLAVHPTASMARLAEDGAQAPARVIGGGVAGGLAWGVRNWLDVGLELAATAMTRAVYPDARVRVSGNPQVGELGRTTRIAQLRAGATLRLGVGWVPTLHVGLGAGGRMRSPAILLVASGGGTELAPDDAAGEVTLDLVTVVRLGLAHRIDRRWTVGLSAGVTQCFGLGAPDAQLFEAALSLAYSWYPR